jgi:hypothetical protein
MEIFPLDDRRESKAPPAALPALDPTCKDEPWRNNLLH